jgi:hypothetical protein
MKWGIVKFQREEFTEYTPMHLLLLFFRMLKLGVLHLVIRKLVIFLIGFQKKTQKTPKKGIDRGRQLMDGYYGQRHNLSVEFYKTTPTPPWKKEKPPLPLLIKRRGASAVRFGLSFTVLMFDG